MTRHSTDFVSALHAERANIISAQGLLSMRLTALDAVLAVYQPRALEPAPVESSAPNADVDQGIDQPVPNRQAAGSNPAVSTIQTPAPQPGSEAAVADADPATAGEALRTDASSAPTLFQQVKQQHEAHPEWTARQIAEAIGRPQTSVQTTLAAVRRGPPVVKPKPPAPVTLADRVKAVLDDHPNWTARQIADHLGTDQKYVVAAAKRKNLSIRRLTPEEFTAARREGGRKGSAAMKARRVTPAAEPQPPEPEPASEPEVAEPPVEAEVPVSPFSPRHGDEPPRIKRPKGTQFRLRAGRGEGKWLHMSGTGLTANRTYAWIGTESQLLAVRRKFPEAQDLYEEVVEKEPARA